MESGTCSQGPDLSRTQPIILISPKYPWASVNGASLHRVILEKSLGISSDQDQHSVTLSDPELDWDLFLHLVGTSGLARGMGDLLKDPVALEYAPPSFPASIKAQAGGEGMKLALCRHVLRLIQDAMTKLGTEGVLLKGAALTLRSWDLEEPFPAKTPGDIDILVPEDSALALRDSLLELGFNGVPQSELVPRENHLELVDYQSLGVEIHTRIADEDWLGKLPESEMLKDCPQLEGWEPFRVLGPEAFLLHTSVHLARHYFTFGLKTTWGQRFTLLNETRIDWEKLADWAAQLRDRRRFWVALQLFNRDLDFPFPSELMNRAPYDGRQKLLIDYASERMHLTDYYDPFFRKHRWLYESAVRDTWSGWLAAATKFPATWKEHRERFRGI